MRLRLLALYTPYYTYDGATSGPKIHNLAENVAHVESVLGNLNYIAAQTWFFQEVGRFVGGWYEGRSWSWCSFGFGCVELECVRWQRFLGRLLGRLVTAWNCIGAFRNATLWFRGHIFSPKGSDRLCAESKRLCMYMHTNTEFSRLATCGLPKMGSQMPPWSLYPRVRHNDQRNSFCMYVFACETRLLYARHTFGN